MPSKKYCEFFNVNESYFPCIDDSAIKAGAPWETTYPHETFIELLDSAEKMLGGATKRSLWIHGSYGTGKSQCAFALKKILEVPDEELRAYWARYEPLKKNKALLEKIIGHKDQGVITAFRYASGSITSPQQLFLAIQESVRAALETIPGSYKGENTLKESVILWLSNPVYNNFVNDLLQNSEWSSTFSQSTADEIIEALRNLDDVSELMDNIFKMAEKVGITALSLNADGLSKWLRDVVNRNHKKIVLIWDEFSDFFRHNRNSLGEFQRIVALCQEIHFYFVIVTHPLSSIAGVAVSKDDPMSVVMQRYNKVEISLPSNIAFELIGHAFSVVDAARSEWDIMTNDLNSKVVDSRRAVMKAVDVKSQNVMKNMLPLHPMAALVLKNIAESFQSNQRSMFDFIKTSKDLDVHAFQWFIQNTAPTSDRPLLTVDMLWDFFYERGKEYLTSDIKVILDTYPQQTNLFENEKIVLKTILIMQAVDQRLGGSIPLLKATDQNLRYVFEGDEDSLAYDCCNIAKSLVKKGVLIYAPIANGAQVYATAVLAGDSAKIDKFKNDIRSKVDTRKLVEEGAQLSSALSLTPSLKLRYAQDSTTDGLPVVTITNFTIVMEQLKSEDNTWRFYAVLALAKTEEEALSFRNLIKRTIENAEYKNILVIDALSTPLGSEAFEEYVGYSAMSIYYTGNRNQQANEYARKAKEVLERGWKDRIRDGAFIVWSYSNQDGEKANGAKSVHTIMQTVVLNRFKYVPDFTKNLSESQLKMIPARVKQCAKNGINAPEKTSGVIAGCEKSVLGKFWERDSYWNDDDLKFEPVSEIKRSVDKLISDSFREHGRIALDEIGDFLETNYGFAPCNLSAFLLGFLLKEYKNDPYRSQDSEGYSVSMTSEKLAEMIGNYYSRKSKGTYIVSLTPEERAFYTLTEKAWSIPLELCTSPSQASSMIQSKMHDLAYPIWTLEEIDSDDVFDIIKLYLEFVQSDGKLAHKIAVDIGKIFKQRPSSAVGLQKLLTVDSCRKGMAAFLEKFEDGALNAVANKIGASDRLLGDLKKLFSVKHAAQWIQSTGEDEIRKLTIEYRFIETTNSLLNTTNKTKEDAFKSWREQLTFIGISCESLQTKYPSLRNLFSLLLKVVNYEDFLPDNVKAIYEELSLHRDEMRDLLDATLDCFVEIYAPYLKGLSIDECEIVKNSIKETMFDQSATQGNTIVKKVADDYRKGQITTQLFNLWTQKTGTKNPKEWSERYRTPILCCVSSDCYSEAKKAFATLNGIGHTDSEVKSALEFCKRADFYDAISDSHYRDTCFMEQVVGDYSCLLTNIAEIRAALEELGISPYDWGDDPRIKTKLREIATAEYYSGGSDFVAELIESIPESQLKPWLAQLAMDNMDLGIKIMRSMEKND